MMFLFLALWLEPPAVPDVYGKVTAVEFFKWKMDGTRGIKIKFSVPLSVTPDDMELTLFDSMKGWDFVRMDAPGDLYPYLSSNQSSQRWLTLWPNWPDRIRPHGNEVEFVAWGHRRVSKDDNLHEPMTAEYIEDWEGERRISLVSEWVVLRVKSERHSVVSILGDISSQRLTAIPGWCGHGEGGSDYRFDVYVNSRVPDRAAWEKKIREAPVWPYSVRNVEFIARGSFEESWSNWKEWRIAKNAKYLEMLPLPLEKIDELIGQDN